MTPLDVLIWAGTILAVAAAGSLTLAIVVGSIKSILKTPKKDQGSHDIDL